MKFRFIKNKKTGKEGFTLVETFVAIAILMMSLVGPLSIAESGLRSAYQSRDRITAYFLAQDAIEFIRAKRDFNSNIGNPWRTAGGLPTFSVLGTCINAQNNAICRFDTNGYRTVETCTSDPTPTNSAGLRCRNLQYNTRSGTYGYGYNNTTQGPASDWRATTFTRDVSIRQANPNGTLHNEVEITVKVSWKGATSPLVIQENLFDWK